MQQKAATVQQAKVPISDQTAEQVALVLAPVILLGIVVLAVRVLYGGIRRLWKFGEVPAVYLRSNSSRRHQED
jgi:hypothetical protein